MKNSFLKVFLALLLAAFLISCAAPSKNERIAQFSNAVFNISIVAKDSDRKISVGTGFLVADDVLATAFHNQPKAEELAKYLKNRHFELVAWKKFANGETLQFPLKIQKKDETNDLALYSFDAAAIKQSAHAAFIKPLRLAKNLPEIGDEVVSIGYYGEYESPFVSLGNISMIDSNEDVFSDLTLMPGNSGAPVLSLKTGEVVGLTVSVLDLGNETVRYGIAKRASKLNELLKK